MKRPTIHFLLREARRLKAQIARTIGNRQRLRTYHQLGRLIRNYIDGRGTWGEKTVAAFASRLDLSVNRTYRLKQFAAAFSVGEVERLVRNAPNASFSHLIHLTGVADKRMRTTFEERLGREKWTVAELHRRIQLRLKKRRQGGRPVKERGAADAIADLQARIDRTSRAWQGSRQAVARELNRGRRKGLRNRLKRLVIAIDGLRDAIEQAGVAR